MRSQNKKKNKKAVQIQTKQNKAKIKDAISQHLQITTAPRYAKGDQKGENAIRKKNRNKSTKTSK